MLLHSEMTIASSVQGLMKNAGVLKMDNPLKQWFCQLACACSISCVSIMFVMIYMSRDDSEKVFEYISILTFAGMSILKLKCLRSNSQSWISLIHTITTLEKQQLEIQNSNTKEYETDDEENELTLSSSHIKKYTQRYQTVSRLIKAFYLFTLLIFITAPFFEYFFRIIFKSEAIKLPYILPGWWFLNELGVSGHITAVIIQLLAACYCLYIHICFDVTAVSFMIFVSGQYRLVRANSERIGGKGNHLLTSKQRDERAHERIKKCHRIHIRLKTFSSKISDLLRNILGIYFFVAAMTFCSIAYRLKTEEVGLLQAASLLQYMCGNLIQLFIFCYYGGDVFTQSAVGMGEGPFAASHWCLDARLRKELELLGAGMIRPSRISAGPFNYLDLSSFIQIIRAAYSYYAVLRK